MKINFFGDVCFNGRLLECPSTNNLVLGKKLTEIVRSADYNLINFEGPETNKENKLRTNVKVVNPIGSINYLESLGFNAFCLTNNHIFDCGIEGYTDTLTKIDELNLFSVRAWSNSKDSITIFKSGNKSVAIIGFTHQEGLMLNDCNKMGNVCYKNYGFIEAKIKKAKKEADFVVAILHGGEEFSIVPPPFRKKICRRVASMGVDAVVCHHSHTPNIHEVYKDIPIFYSLGNFMFDLPQYSQYKLVDVGLVLTLDFKEDRVSHSYESLQFDFDKLTIEVNNSFKIDIENIQKEPYLNSWMKDCFKIVEQKRSSKKLVCSPNTIEISTRIKLGKKLRSIFKLLKNENRRSIEMAALFYTLWKRLL